ncbi:FecR domain-containing protein [Massilia sp. G4R7]|uniref:FecR domain-containing protein n=1 Tax=Massilia phyllostachyos TaxID=2898585 RepID=A0ABS8Q941_9BURK|nr:FecR domain-containing protein [Massilia phyllostachyos]MCD2518280.1 FecR domain-containing protein [Massilia phyllostachyos]
MNDKNSAAETIEEAAARWLAREDAADWNPKLEREREDWLRADTRHRVAWLRLHAAWRTADGLRGQDAVTPAARAALPRFSTWRIAAGVLLAVALGAWLAPLTGERGEPVERYATRIGENRIVALADGSRVTLNTGTRLRAAKGQGRHVWLDDGEAYFDVAHDPASPFVIEAGASRITVLGTRFTVRREDGRVRVLVEQGRVRVSERGASVELARNQEALAQDGRIVRSAFDAAALDKRMAWREGRIVFDQASLADAAAEFNRYNERRLVVTGPAARIVVGGSFAPTNVDGFVRLLEQGFGLKSERRGKDIVISR